MTDPRRAPVRKPDQEVTMSTIEQSIELEVTAYNQWTQFEEFPEFMGDLERFKDLIESRGRESGAWRGNVPRGS
jgi:hypothetical protein